MKKVDTHKVQAIVFFLCNYEEVCGKEFEHSMYQAKRLSR